MNIVLERLDYGFDVKSNAFNKMSYEFSLGALGKSEEDKNKIKGFFSTMEKIIDSELKGRNIKKEKKGSIDKSLGTKKVSFGYTYHSLRENLHISLDYSISSSELSKGICKELNMEKLSFIDSNFNLYHSDGNGRRVLNIYDKIKGLDSVKMTEESKKSAEDIETIRNKDIKDKNLYLEYID